MSIDCHTHHLPYEFDLLALHQSKPLCYPYLLESVAKNNTQARYDILFAYPSGTLELSADYQLTAQGSAPALNLHNHDFLSHFDHWWQEERCRQNIPASLPFSGGWFIYLAYELMRQIEPHLSFDYAPIDTPVAVAVRIPAAIIIDHVSKTTTIICEQEHQHILHQIIVDANALTAEPPPRKRTLATHPVIEEDPQRFLDGVEQIKKYIHAGDVFQVNLSRLWTSTLDDESDYIDLYRQLRDKNPALFAGLVKHHDTVILSSSPERLVMTHNGRVETRPIAGTRPRSSSKDKDENYQAELLLSTKECAEHIMLIDLERNDLGRICIPGSINVNELMSVESYAHVHHIISNLCGKLCADTTPGAVIRAVFPGGTITGCPKIRCMEIIAELEQQGRGAYTGAIGYINRNGNMDLNILIRSMTIKNQAISLRAGAGIVADSIAQHELEETRIKAHGLLLALGAG